MRLHVILAPAALFLFACSSSSNGDATDTKFQAQVVTGMHDDLLAQITTLHQAAVDMQAAAPAPTGRGWDATLDKEALATFTTAWMNARHAYERTEGAIAPLFPDIDTEIDARYDDFLSDSYLQKAGGDQDLFDDQGVTGMHAIERILYAPTTPAYVITTEATFIGYKAAAWPATEAEAAEFKNKLCARLVTDTQTLHDDWKPQANDLDSSYGGLVALMNEQREKVNKASTGEEESRYSQRTMADIRDNLAGTKDIYALFQPWIQSKPNGKTIDAGIEASFATLDADYATVTGDAIPEPPSGWQNASANSQADLDSPFGKLFTTVNAAVDPNVKGSAVYEMNEAATAIGFQEFVDP